jgi:glycosyltransferase involved in cell wall biosynthesis
MKIAIVQDILRSGGTERQTVFLGNAFGRSPHLPTIVTFRPGGALSRTLENVVLHEWLQPFDTGLDWFAPRLVAKLRSLTPDIVLCMGRMANCYAGMLQEKLRPAAVVATMRTGKPLPPRYLHSLRTVRHVVANSREARSTLIQAYDIDANKISVIYNSLVFAPPIIPAPEFAAARTEFRQSQGATPSTHVLLSVAMFRKEKNQRELIELVAALPTGIDWQLWLAGDGPELAACRQLVARHQLSSRVKFLGLVADPRPLYRAADIAVHVSRSEALSNFLIEAQAHGLPAVAYDTQGIQECFMPGITGWATDPENPWDFRARLEQLFAQPPAERAALAATARGYARQNFDPQLQANAYIELFERLLRNRQPA